MEYGSDSVMGEVAESEDVCAQCFEASVDAFAGCVGRVVIEEGQGVVASAPQGAAELGDLPQSGGTPRRIEPISAIIARLLRRRLASTAGSPDGWLSGRLALR